ARHALPQRGRSENDLAGPSTAFPQVDTVLQRSGSTTGRDVMRTLAIVAALIAAIGPACAAEINAFVSTAIKAATDELLPPFERTSARVTRASYAPWGALPPRCERGEPVDIFLTDSTALDELIKRGKIVAPRVDLVRTGIGICVRKGAPKPDV